MSISMKKKKILFICVWATVLVAIAAYFIVVNFPSEEHRVEERLGIALPADTQIINYQMLDGYFVAKLSILNDYLDEFSNKLKAEEFMNSQQQKEWGYIFDLSKTKNDVKWWNFDSNKVIECYYRNATLVYIVKNDNDTFYVYIG